MKRLLITSGIAGKFLRMCRFVLPAILVLGATAAAAQLGSPIGQPLNNGTSNSNSLVGQWRGVYQGITFTIVIQPNGQYSQIAQKGTLMTQQSGPYKLVAPNTLIFSVTNWAPRTQKIYHPYPPSRNGTPSAGGYYTSQVVAKPPGATDAYVFNGPNTVTLTDQVMHGSITMTRVP
ncbi:MAG: hypothetical protein ABSA85_09880 [Terracidiphilus sp.]